MATRRDRSPEVRELALMFYRLMRERESTSTARLKVSPSLSRILRHLPEWRALRRHGEAPESARVAKEPSFFTVVDAAKELDVPLCALVPTVEHQPLTEPQRKALTIFARWLLGSFARDAGERAAYARDFEEFEAYDVVRKQAHALAASRVGTDAQFEPDETDVLASIRGIRSERLQVIRVRGDSMANRLRDGDRVLIDIQRRTPRNGEMVAVDRDYLGRVIGYWRRTGKRCFLDKENEAAIELGSPEEFTILGTITGIVWAPFRVREP